jgi:catechol 2,3-dioxygenase-like lactoylglutathione lyase family enzyme
MSRARHVLTILAVEDVPRARGLYDAAFGWPTDVDLPVYVEYVLPGDQRIGLYARRGFARNTGVVPVATPTGAIAPTELYLRVDDLEEAAGRLAAAGARLLSPAAPRDWGDTVAYFADLDGNVLAIARPGHAGIKE